MTQTSDATCLNGVEFNPLFRHVASPYATQPLLCLHTSGAEGRIEVPTLKLSCTSIGWGLELSGDDSCRWLTDPAVNAFTFLRHYGDSYLWHIRDASVWTMDMILDIVESLPAHSYALVELSHVLHSIPTNVFVRLLTALTQLCRSDGVLRWVEGSWLQTQSVLCVQAMNRVRYLASERPCGCPDVDHTTMGDAGVLPTLMQQWLGSISGQPVRRLDASLRIARSQQTLEQRALACHLPFWLRIMSKEDMALPYSLSLAYWRDWHQRLVDEILHPSCTATCTLHILWTRP